MGAVGFFGRWVSNTGLIDEAGKATSHHTLISIVYCIHDCT